ncbi:MAG: hypothetical protein CL931_08130 [Deltaproteobacteria bacterium]|nr:hypothetical protein [Deltaproteobacteria bacterium]
MRSNLITVVTAVASIVLTAGVATADQVQEQLMLMEQRMAEMEDRLQATSDELAAAQATVVEQKDLLIDSGLYEDEGLRSGAGGFFESVDISGVAAASYNHRVIEGEEATGGNPLFKTPNANTFQLDQIWMIVDKAPTEDSRGGFHAEFVAGTSANSQIGGLNNDGTVGIYSAYASYLAPVGNGVQIDLGQIPTPLGAEVVQTNGNYFITQGAVFGLQPVVHTGVAFTTQLTDSLGFTGGIVNDVYSDTGFSGDNDKAYYGQFQYSGDTFGLNVGGIIGDADAGECGVAGVGNNAECRVSLVDVVLSADPTDNLSIWVNYDWKHSNGASNANNGDAHGISGAGRLALSDDMGISSRVEYIWTEDTLAGAADDSELLTVTGTIDKTLAEGLVGRLELRYDTAIEGNGFAARGDAVGTNNDSLVALWQMYYEF